jgi:16S rRNA (adenine1518-N6/adenine1519-N6)-dimethyltransferase
MIDSGELPPLRDVIARYGLGARKALGQHFLLDLNLTGRIARAAPDLSQGTVIEVGPGPGGLTRALLAEGATRLVAIEKDRRCLDALAEIAAAWPGRLQIVEGDALQQDIAMLGPAPRQIVSNLPYNVSTALLVNWLTALARDPAALAAMTLMFQKEVAERLVATPRSGAYGRLSVLTQWLCAPRLLFDIPPRAFTPPPKVVSTVVAVTPRPKPLAPASLTVLERVTAAAFGQRRKMLRQSLKSLGGETATLFETTGILPTARAEELSVEEFCALARAVEAASASGSPA